MHSKLFALVLALTLSAALPAGAQDILIYGPGGSHSIAHFSGTPTVTVWNETEWRAATTADFDDFDLLWVGGSGGDGCSASPAAFQALFDTQAAWGPAVTGRVAITTSDPDFHANGADAGAIRFIRNHQAWLGALGATGDGGQTGFMFATGCAYAFAATNGIDNLEPTFGAPLTQIGGPNGEPTALLDGGHPLMTGLTLSGGGADLRWGFFAHGSIGATIPTGFTALIEIGAALAHIYRDELDLSCDTDQCTIGTACVDDGTVNPANSCEVCEVATDDAGWTPRSRGTRCDDGLFCTVSDQCDGAGSCGGEARDCDDGLSCTTDTCDETDDECDSPITDGCLVDGVCYGDGDLDPDNDCQGCFPSGPPAGGAGGGGGSRTSFLPLPGGSGCDDGLFCTLNDRCDGAASCVGSERACADVLDCTRDMCNETTDACEHVPVVGCAIDDTCVAAGTVNPDNGCEACRPLVDPTDWSPLAAGTACDDGLFCTTGDVCRAGACVGEARDCSDGLSCTLDACDDVADECTNDVDMGSSCTIDGACVANGARNPTNDCEVCDSAADATDWSPVAAGSACTDGAFCTTGDACDGAGACTGSPRDCDDGLGCTTDACDETADACTSTLGAGCLIDGACFAAGASSPTDPCLVCDPTVAGDGFSPAAVGTSCDDGLFCTTGDACDAAGACTGGARDCDDGLACTTNACNELTDSCSSAITEGCLIDGVCVADEAPSDEDPCAWCDAETRRDAYSPRPAGERCGDPMCSGEGLITAAATCDDEGDCVPGVGSRCESGMCADETMCADGCSDDSLCPDDAFCSEDGECVDDGGPGDDCDRDEMCSTGFCADGVCCDERCDGACEACDVADSEGTCSPYGDGTDPEDECEDGVCDGSGECRDDTPGDDAGPGEVDAGPPAGTDAGMGGVDAGPGGVDAGDTTTGGPSGGCGCATERGDAPPSTWLLLAVAVFLVRRRR